MKTLFVFALLGCALPLRAQEPHAITDSASRHHFRDIIYVHRDRSYITAGGGLGNVEPLMFEARLSPGFVMATRNKNRGLLLNPQVVARMDHKRSFPINSPSYKANLFYYQGIDLKEKSFLKKLFYDEALWYASINHYSNGGDGSFYVGSSDKIVNLEDGSFSTDYATLGFSSYKVKKKEDGLTAFRLAKAGTEFHFPNSTTENMLSVFGRYRFSLTWKSAGLWDDQSATWLKKWRQHSGIEVQTGWIAGRILQVSSGNINKRWMLDISYHYYPSWFNEISFFIRFYRGQDYYNIYFVNTIHIVNFGINTNLMNPAQVVKNIGKKR